MLNVPQNWQDRLFPDWQNAKGSTSVYYVGMYPNSEKIQGIFTVDEGTLNGAAATLYEDGHLQTLAENYKEGCLHGALRQWNKDGTRLFYGQYLRGEKDGVICLFQNGMPWLIQDWDKGKLLTEYFVKGAQGGPRIVPTTPATGDEKAKASEVHEQLNALDKKMEEGERKLKQFLNGWYKKRIKQMRQPVASAHAAAARDATSNRLRKRDAQNEAMHDEVWRRALRGSGF
jgi:antitoxin component YwqK of YwqJK toxin-antitoxin module